jgi:threonine dehydratase
MEGVRVLFSYANLKVEPTGALSLGAVLENSEKFADKKVCAVVSGGNVDAEIYRRIIA